MFVENKGEQYVETFYFANNIDDFQFNAISWRVHFKNLKSH